MHKIATKNISTNGLSHFFKQSHLAVRAIGSFIYNEKEVKKVPLKTFLYGTEPIYNKTDARKTKFDKTNPIRCNAIQAIKL